MSQKAADYYRERAEAVRSDRAMAEFLARWGSTDPALAHPPSDEPANAPVPRRSDVPDVPDGQAGLGGLPVASLPLSEGLDGSMLLDEVRAVLVRFVVFPIPEAADAVALWIAATHAQPAWAHATRLVITSPAPRCGKTRLLELVAELSWRPLRTSSISAAALARSLDEQDPPTLVLDEQDAIFGTRRNGQLSERAEDLRSIINAGFRRGWPYVRWNPHGPGGGRREECPTFAMAALAAIGDLPDTVMDRAIVVAMRRQAAHERVAKYRLRSAQALAGLRDRLHAWARHRLSDLAEAEPCLEGLGLDDRAEDAWEPLLAIADAAGGSWPARARAAAVALSEQRQEAETDAGLQLLTDLRAVWEAGEHWLPSTTLCERLAGLLESPWATWSHGQPINPHGLSRLLRRFGVRPERARLGGASNPIRGYARVALEDPWSRYLGDPPGTAGTSGTEAAEVPNPRSEAAESPVPLRLTASGTQSGTGLEGLSTHESGPDRGSWPLVPLVTHGMPGPGPDKEPPPPTAPPPDVLDEPVEDDYPASAWDLDDEPPLDDLLDLLDDPAEGMP